MQNEESLIRLAKKMFEEKTGWGDSENWTNQDFLQLSDLIRDQTGVMLSHVTLKRVWGKVKYDSLPNTHTLNTLVQFLGYDTWRDFAAKNPLPKETTQGATETMHGASDTTREGLDTTQGGVESMPGAPDKTQGGVDEKTPQPETAGGDLPVHSGKHPALAAGRKIWVIAPLLVAVLLVLVLLHGQQPPPQPQDYAFSSKKIVSSGVPNSVVFDYDATRSPDDSVVIQQSWDTTRRVKVPRNGHQYTSIYYYPDFYHPTLQVQNQVVKSHNLLIESNGWLPLIEQKPVPIYFKTAEAIHDGKLSLSLDQIREKNVPLQPSPPTVLFSNVRDFGEIYSDHFVFETSLKNEYSEGSSACQLTKVFLLCEGTAIWIPLCAKGCVSNIDLFFTYFFTSGKREDLSAFGVNFSDYVKLRVESDSGRAKILINNQLAYTVPWHIKRSKIIGFDFSFQGTGSIDYVLLTNGKISYRDDFDFVGGPAL